MNIMCRCEKGFGGFEILILLYYVLSLGLWRNIDFCDFIKFKNVNKFIIVEFLIRVKVNEVRFGS